jgi:hypothetical protein
VARGLSRQPGVDGVDRVDEGALREDGSDVWPPLGGVEVLHDGRRTAIPRERVPVVPDVVRERLQSRFGGDRMPAVPPVLCRAAALLRRVGVHAQPVRQGVGPRRAATRQGPRTTGPIGPDPLAENLVHLHGRDLEAGCTGVSRALATGGVLAVKVTGLVDATALETTAPEAGGGQGTRPRQVTDTRGQGRELEGTGSGVQRIVVSVARTKRPLAATGGPIPEPAGLSTRARVTQARPHLAGPARLPQVVCARGGWMGCLGGGGTSPRSSWGCRPQTTGR